MVEQPEDEEEQVIDPGQEARACDFRRFWSDFLDVLKLDDPEQANAKPSRAAIDNNLRDEPLRSDEIDAFRFALIAANLRADDISATGVQPFRFERKLKPVGYGALEVYGPD